ncbi:MAG: class I SAM-dependent methyltransferase [Candidatus Pacebacteria bacterium]|nr:class I SAM-dependent methyltransferase [Candidatus Paceibacterota bacterium]
MEKESIRQFTDKYKKANFIEKILLKNFFNTIKSIIPENTKSVAEIGCGAGISTEKLRDFFINQQTFFASDLDPELVEMAKEKNKGVSFGVESIYDLNHTDGEFDLVFCLEVMEHLEEPEKALKEISRITKEYVIISVPREPLWRILNMARGSYWKDLGNTPGHINHWSKRGVSKFISREFKVLKVCSSTPWTIVLAQKK